MNVQGLQIADLTGTSQRASVASCKMKRIVDIFHSLLYQQISLRPHTKVEKGIDIANDSTRSAVEWCAADGEFISQYRSKLFTKRLFLFPHI